MSAPKSRNILPPRRAWTPHELCRLRELYPDLLASTVARELGRPVEAVYRKARELGLCKTEAFIASELSRRIKRGHQSPAMVASRFQPGSRPWNKGVKGSTGMHPNTRATQFKKGQMRGAAQHNYVPIGSERICADGYLERKMTDDPSIYPASRWVAVHRLVWIAAHGAIPAGHVVVFQPGKKTVKLHEITVDRLSCITRAELALRNHPRNKSPELARLVQLKGAITRQVNRIARESGEGAKA
ncbi:HNH endonuclease [Acidovorax sp. NCPPB 3576]|uniref:HNH endonuclease n=1 Tax=Acidovorax sp. NCPPB 3576 TaxID=2940488 RepID=UPI002349E3AE|nr:HNH endonuclease [Acidovorax sp. NCPPB 3576]WCM88534.1 HNH endonuclease [Acidovorax sp. NCPPB 3576]